MAAAEESQVALAVLLALLALGAPMVFFTISGRSIRSCLRSVDKQGGVPEKANDMEGANEDMDTKTEKREFAGDKDQGGANDMAGENADLN